MGTTISAPFAPRPLNYPRPRRQRTCDQLSPSKNTHMCLNKQISKANISRHFQGGEVQEKKSFKGGRIKMREVCLKKKKKRNPGCTCTIKQQQLVVARRGVAGSVTRNIHPCRPPPHTDTLTPPLSHNMPAFIPITRESESLLLLPAFSHPGTNFKETTRWHMHPPGRVVTSHSHHCFK